MNTRNHENKFILIVVLSVYNDSDGGMGPLILYGRSLHNLFCSSGRSSEFVLTGSIKNK